MRSAHLTLPLCLLGACASVDDTAPDGVTDDPGEDVVELDRAGVDLEAAALPAAAARLFYGVTVQGQSLVYYKVTPPSPSGKKAFLTFAIHGFEDAWKQDGRALYSIAHEAIEYYGANPARLRGWTLYVVPSANPDGMRYGVNNWRESAGAYGRCTSAGKDINRHVSSGTSVEQRKLKALFDAVKPTIAIDFHGWYNTYYGNSRIGGYFQSAFNAAYEGKPARYCYVASTGAMDCGPTRGGIFHGSSTIGTDLFAEWAMNDRGVPSALVEYPAPDFNLSGLFDTVWDSELGYRRLATNTLNLLWGRTRVALDNLFATY
jgi:hypothetical protein